MEQVASALPHKGGEERGGDRDRDATDNYWILELLWASKDDRRAKRQQLKQILQGHFGRGELATGGFRRFLADDGD